MILAIDLGTTGVRCIAYSATWEKTFSNYIELSFTAPQPGHVEQNLGEILDKTIQVIAMTWHDAGSPDEVLLAITNQRESLAIWNPKDGVPLHPVISWQDTRYGNALESLIKNGLESRVHKITGLQLFPYFTAGKIAWFFEKFPAMKEKARRGEIAMGTLDGWLVWSLTGGSNGGRHVTDVSNASRMCLMDLKRVNWSKELLEYFGVPEEVLPTIVPSAHQDAYGIAQHPRLPFQAPIVTVIGDQQAALVGQGCLRWGEAKNSYGTASAILINTETEMHTESTSLLSTVLFQCGVQDTHYALEGSTGSTGGILTWLRDNIQLYASIQEADSLAQSVSTAGGIYFVPALSGLYAPYWDLEVRGIISGLTVHTTKAHMVRAAYESIAFQTYDVLQAAQQEAGVNIKELKVDGGGTRSDFLMQLQAEILGIPVVRSTDVDVTARGAAYLAGLVTKQIDIEAIRILHNDSRVFEPSWSADQRISSYNGWKNAVTQARFKHQG